jgi:hypothetical protein
MSVVVIYTTAESSSHAVDSDLFGRESTCFGNSEDLSLFPQKVLKYFEI